MRPRAQSSAQRYYGTTRDSLLNCLFIVKRWVEEWGGWFSHEVSEASTAGSSYPCAALRNCFDDAHPMDGNWKPGQAQQQTRRRYRRGKDSNGPMALCRHELDSGSTPRAQVTGYLSRRRRRLCSVCVEYIRHRPAIFAPALLSLSLSPGKCPSPPTCASQNKPFSPCGAHAQWRCVDPLPGRDRCAAPGRQPGAAALRCCVLRPQGRLSSVAKPSHLCAPDTFRDARH
jgi:hypothetical protein